MSAAGDGRGARRAVAFLALALRKCRFTKNVKGEFEVSPLFKGSYFYGKGRGAGKGRGEGG